MGNLLDNTIKILRLLLPKNITLSCNIEKNLPLIKGNPIQIQQALINISNNSVQAMGERKGTLKISLCLEENNTHSLSFSSGNCLKLCMEDEGCGMSDDVIDRIFDPFFTTKEPGKGTGLGLSVVHGIIKAHKGEISLKSKQNAGTVICMSFPFVTGESKAGNYVPGSKLHGCERILIVEDEVELSKVIDKSLSKLDYRVTVSSSAKEAFEKIRTNPDKFDIVISDYAMPEMNGIELYEKLCGIRKNFPFIIVTGYMNIDLEKYINETENIEYLKKPVKIHELTNLIRSFFDK